MAGDVKGVVAVSGEWFAVYAPADLDSLDFKLSPVLFWMWTEQDDRAEFVGAVDFGANIISAEAPDLLGYLGPDEDAAAKFGPTLAALRREELTHENERLREIIRSHAEAHRVSPDDLDPEGWDSASHGFTLPDLCLCCDPPVPINDSIHQAEPLGDRPPRKPN